jgi:predicted nucleotide-binding protein
VTSKRRSPERDAAPQTTLPAIRGIDLLRTRHAIGQHMRGHPHIDPKQLDTWTKATSELLRRVFGEDHAAASFDSAGLAGDAAAVDEARTRMRLEARLARLGELIERAAGLYEAPPELEAEAEDARTRRVLLLHAGDKDEVEPIKRLLETVGCVPVVFHDEPGGAPTRLETLEQSAKDAAFAVVLLTGEGRDKHQPSGTERLRARQRTIFELGYLIAALGRQQVCVLHQPSVEVPSECAGVVLIPVDEHDAWQSSLVKTLEAAHVAGNFAKLA